jgi:hypothetical protein
MDDRKPGSDTSRQQRVLVGDSVYEQATITIHDGRLFIEFDSADLDSITVDLRALGLAD